MGIGVLPLGVNISEIYLGFSMGFVVLAFGVSAFGVSAFGVSALGLWNILYFYS